MNAKSTESSSSGSLRESFFLMSGRCGLRSKAMGLRLRSLQTSMVVPEPHMGSMTVSFSLV